MYSILNNKSLLGKIAIAKVQFASIFHYLSTLFRTSNITPWLWNLIVPLGHMCMWRSSVLHIRRVVIAKDIAHFPICNWFWNALRSRECSNKWQGTWNPQVILNLRIISPYVDMTFSVNSPCLALSTSWQKTWWYEHRDIYCYGVRSTQKQCI